MFEQLGQQSNTIFPDQPGRLVPVLVIFKSVIDRQSGHSDIHRRLGWIARPIMLQDRPILQRSFGEENDVNIMVEFGFDHSEPFVFTTRHVTL